MACTIDATVGGAAANSYSTTAEANAYHDTHLYASVWTGVDETKCKALQMATRLLDAMFDWYGEAADDDQRLSWPRIGVEGRVGIIESTVLPDELKEATAELARQLLASNTTADSAVEVQGLTALKVGPIELSFGSATGRAIPDAVFYMVSHLGSLKQRGGGGSVPLERA